MVSEFWQWIVEFVSSEHEAILSGVIIGLAVAGISGLIVMLKGRLCSKRNRIDDEPAAPQGKPLAEELITVRRNRMNRPRFELIVLKSFSNANGRCRYAFEIENAGGLALNVLVTSKVYEGRINLKDMKRRARGEISFDTDRPIYEVCFDFEFDLPDGSSSSAVLPIHAKTDGKWYAGGVGAN
ncbi:hypothetical protein ACYCFK_09220 [Stutzerimonas stutzeri]